VDRITTMKSCREALDAVLNPLHWAAQTNRSKADHHLIGIQMLLGPETAA
jgi:hypothetical protein